MTDLKTVKLKSSFFKRTGDTCYTWLGMAGVLINARGTVIMIDPLITVINFTKKELSETGHSLRIKFPIDARDIPRVDAVLYTHPDADHFGVPTALMLERRKPIFIGTMPVLKQMKALGVEGKRLRFARAGNTLKTGNAKITVTKAAHNYPTSPWTLDDCVGYVVESKDGRIWHPGDTKMLEGLKKIKNIDVLFFDVAKVMFHLGPGGSAKLAKSSGAKTLFAYHYGTYEMKKGMWGNCDPKDSLPYLKGTEGRFITPSPGKVFRLDRGRM